MASAYWLTSLLSSDFNGWLLNIHVHYNSVNSCYSNLQRETYFSDATSKYGGNKYSKCAGGELGKATGVHRRSGCDIWQIYHEML